MMYNIGSLALGFSAWIIALAANQRGKHREVLIFSSFGCTCAALLLQFLEIKRRAELGDWPAIEDTIEGVIFGAVVLIGVTLVLNLVALIRKKEG